VTRVPQLAFPPSRSLTVAVLCYTGSSVSMYQLSIARITRLTYGLGAAGVLATLVIAGPRSAVGFLAGVALSLISVRSWAKLAEAVGGVAAASATPEAETGTAGASKPKSGGSAAGAALFLVARYAIIAGAVYVSIKYLGSAPAAVLVGLLVSFVAAVLDFLLGTARS
jgi:hypothetical protein